MYVSPHGKAAGLSDRLTKFAHTLAKDNRYPWLGTGLIDDLRAAAAIIEGRPVPPTMDEVMAMERSISAIFGTIVEPELKPTLEYDL